ncbi:pullulanase-associated domain-containing protein [Photobacterium ganghwense]|uniref:pullulanase-associated domain-containing protein n=1 Tax=Photobacterium ganghwense TaxID=320778 RepID=UPI0039F1032F
MKLKGILLCVATLSMAGCGGGGGDGTDTDHKASSSVTRLSSPYLPAEQGAVWRYTVEDSGENLSLSSSAVKQANGKETVDLTWDHSGYQQTLRYQGNTLSIEHLHFDKVTVNNTDYKVDMDLSTAPALLLPEFSVITPEGGINSRQQMQVTISPDAGSTYGEYSLSWSYKGIETIETPAGRYEALHVQYSLSLDVFVALPDDAYQGDSPQGDGSFRTQVPVLQDLWFSPGIGIVKISDSSASIYSPVVAELTDFNRYRDNVGNLTTMPDSTAIPADSPWKNIRQAYKLDQLYGNWESAYHCNPVETQSPSFQLSLTETNYTLTTRLTDNENCSGDYWNDYVESGTYILRGFDPQDAGFLLLDLIPSSSTRQEYRFGHLLYETPDWGQTRFISLAPMADKTARLGIDEIPNLPNLATRLYAELTAVEKEPKDTETLNSTALVYFQIEDENYQMLPEEAHAGWGMQVWNDATCDAIMDAQLSTISWEQPLQPAGFDPLLGLYFELQIKENNTGCANVIFHKGEEKSVEQNQTIDLNARYFYQARYGAQGITSN